MRSMFFTILLTYVVVRAASLSASCGSSSCPIDLHPLQLTAHSPVVIDLSFQYIDQNRLRGSSSETESDHQEIRTVNRLSTLQVSYLFAPRFQLSAAVPFVDRFHEHIDRASGTIESWQFGAIGDATLQGRVRVLQRDAVTDTSLWLSGGVKLSTGARHETSRGDDPEQGEVTIQPGSGSTDILLGLSWQGGVVRETTLRGRMGSMVLLPYFASVTLRRNGRGTDAYRRGDEMQASAGTEVPITSALHLLAQLNVRRAAKDEPGSTGENPDLTGGTHLYASPGLRLLAGKRASVYAYVQLPLYERVNGVQLTSRANYLVGVQQRF